MSFRVWDQFWAVVPKQNHIWPTLHSWFLALVLTNESDFYYSTWFYDAAADKWVVNAPATWLVTWGLPCVCFIRLSVSPFFIFTFFECLLPLICSGCDCWKETQSLSRLSSYWDFGSLVKRLQLHLVKQSSYGMCMNVTCLKVVANWYVSEINCTFVFQFWSFFAFGIYEWWVDS